MVHTANPCRGRYHKDMLGYILSALLVMAPLPGLPAIPDGAEVRIVSADLRTVFLFWRVERGELRLQSRPFPIPRGGRVRLIIRTGRQLHAYEGRYLNGDIYIEVSGGYLSVKRVFAKVYHLRWPRSDRFFNGGKTQPSGRQNRGTESPR